MRAILACDAVVVSVEPVRVARIKVVDPLRVLLVLEVVAVVEISLGPLGRTLCRYRSKETRNPTRNKDERHGYSSHAYSPALMVT